MIGQTNPPLILALGGSDHDVHACIFDRNKIVANIEEERLNRKKYGLGGNLLEGRAWRYCLDAAGNLPMSSLDQVVADLILAPSALYSCDRSAERYDHHLLHAANAFFTSPFDSAAVLVVDNAGDIYRDEHGKEKLQATSSYMADLNQIKLIDRVGSTNWIEGPQILGKPYQRGDGDHSLGHFYKKITGALGFKFPQSESDFFFPEDGITMGLAPYGDHRHVDELWSLVELRERGNYRLRLTDGRMDHLLLRWLSGQPDFTARAAVAAAGQEVLTRLLCHIVDNLLEVTSEDRLCLGGGVAMNSVANGEIFGEPEFARSTSLRLPEIMALPLALLC